MVVAACPRVEELTFDPERRRMATIHTAGAEVWVAVKGAFEAIGPLLDPAEADLLRQAGARRRALCRRRLSRARLRRTHDRRRPRPSRRRGARPPPSWDRRDGGPAARGFGPVDRSLPCGRHHADHDHRRSPADGQRHCPTDRTPAPGGRSLTGAELEQLDDAAFDAIVADVAVYARTNPSRSCASWTPGDAVGRSSR